MALRVGRAREAEDGGRGDGDADAVRDERLRGGVARVSVAFVLPADGVAHPVAEVDAGVAEADAGEGGGEQHLRLGFGVVRVADGAGEVFDCGAERLEGEDVGYGIRALVGWAGDWVVGTGGSLVVGDCGPGFEAVAENVETGGGVHGRGHRAGVEGVANPQGRSEGAMGDAGFCFLGD